MVKEILSYRLTCHKITFPKCICDFIDRHITKFSPRTYTFFILLSLFCMYFVEGVIQGSIEQRELSSPSAGYKNKET